MATSSCPAVKAHLLSVLLAAFPETEERVVRYSHPGSLLRTENIYLGDAKEAFSTIPTAKSGRKRREEEYTLEVIFEVIRPGDSAAPAETRAFELFATFEDYLADNVGLAQPNPTLRAKLDGWESSCTFTEANRGWRCELTARVKIENRLA